MDFERSYIVLFQHQSTRIAWRIRSILPILCVSCISFTSTADFRISTLRLLPEKGMPFNQSTIWAQCKIVGVSGTSNRPSSIPPAHPSRDSPAVISHPSPPSTLPLSETGSMQNTILVECISLSSVTSQWKFSSAASKPVSAISNLVPNGKGPCVPKSMERSSHLRCFHRGFTSSLSRMLGL